MRGEKSPKLSKDTRLLSFDLEANGLHGQAFAVGAVVMDADGQILNEFSGRVAIDEPIDEWVAKNVLPAIEDMPITHDSYEKFKEDFWQWFVNAQDQSDYVLVNSGYPVEHRFLIECQEENIKERYWQHPFPILDLPSLMIQIGESPLANKTNFVKKEAKLHTNSAHHPLQDAIVAAHAAFKAFKIAGQI